MKQCIAHQKKAVLALIVLALVVPCRAEEKQPGLVEKLGETIPLDLTFQDENNQDVILRDLIKKPTVLTLVYYRCPNICSPLLQELARVVQLCKSRPGRDYQLITISFDKRETSELSRIAADSIAGSMETPIPKDSWRFMTGDEENINALADSVGFNFVQDENGDFTHPATVIFLTKEGKIVRYLGGLEMLPADMDLAIVDATKGRARNFMQKIQRLCYTYDPKGKKYVFQINRIILGCSLIVAFAFACFLFFQSKKRRREQAQAASLAGKTNESERTNSKNEA